MPLRDNRIDSDHKAKHKKLDEFIVKILEISIIYKYDACLEQRGETI